MRKTAAYAFHHSIPILIGFFPVGIAYGLLMQQAGYNFLWSGACSLFVLAGSLQFLMVTFFAGGVSLATVAVLALRSFRTKNGSGAQYNRAFSLFQQRL